MGIDVSRNHSCDDDLSRSVILPIKFCRFFFQIFCRAGFFEWILLRHHRDITFYLYRILYIIETSSSSLSRRILDVKASKSVQNIRQRQDLMCILGAISGSSFKGFLVTDQDESRITVGFDA